MGDFECSFALTLEIVGWKNHFIINVFCQFVLVVFNVSKKRSETVFAKGYLFCEDQVPILIWFRCSVCSSDVVVNSDKSCSDILKNITNVNFNKRFFQSIVKRAVDMYFVDFKESTVRDST